MVGRANLNAYQSAISFYYQQHGYTRPWIGMWFNRFTKAYTAARAMRARSNGEKEEGLREEISEVALEWMLSNGDHCPEPTKRGRLLIVLIMVLSSPRVIFIRRRIAASTATCRRGDDTAFKEGIKPHGGWKTSSSAERDVNDDYQVQPDGVVRQIFDFMPRNA